MTRHPNTLRVVTYNIHKCRGIDRRTDPARIAAVLHAISPDVACLQEVVHAPGGTGHFDHANQIAAALPGYVWAFGSNRELHGGAYGNMTLTRLPVLHSANLDITRPGREPRGVLQTDITAPSGHIVHVFNAHLGTGFMERRFQAQRLLSHDVLSQPNLTGPRLVLGDFNEWTSGLTTRLLRESFQSFQPRHSLRFPRTFPGVLPLLTLDHCFYEPPLHLHRTRLYRTQTALLASDHLPLIADFTFTPTPK